MSQHFSWKHLMETPVVKLAADAGMVGSAVILPMWVYTFSAWAGFITVMLGLVLVIVRLAIAFRDFKRGRIIHDEDIADVG